MMKKLLVVMLVFGLASWAWAVPYFEISGPLPIKDSYMPSEWILIDLVSPTQDLPVISVTIDSITDNSGAVPFSTLGEADGPQVFHANFGTQFPGLLNADGQLVEYMGASDATIPARGATGTLYSFWYHVPDVPYSTIIDIQTDDDGGDFWYPAELVYAGVTEHWIGTIHMNEPIHVVPEPATLVLLGLGGLFLRRRRKQQTA
jgi:hypothetical protein